MLRTTAVRLPDKSLERVPLIRVCVPSEQTAQLQRELELYSSKETEMSHRGSSGRTHDQYLIASLSKSSIKNGNKSRNFRIESYKHSKSLKSFLQKLRI